MSSLLSRLGSNAAAHPGRFIVSWLVLLGIAIGGFASFGGALKTSFDVPGTASGDVIDRLTDELPDMAGGTGMVVYQTHDGSPFSTAQAEQISHVAADAENLPGVASVIDPFAAARDREERIADLEEANDALVEGRSQLESAQGQLADGRIHLEAALDVVEDKYSEAVASGAAEMQLQELKDQRSHIESELSGLEKQKIEVDTQLDKLDDSESQTDNASRLMAFAEAITTVSEDGLTAIVAISYKDASLDLPQDVKDATIDHFTDNPVSGVSIEFSASISQENPELFGTGEMISLAVAAVVLVVMLGSLLAAALPLMTALVGVAVGVAASLSFSGIVDMASITPVLGVMLGLAVGLDYSLFIVNRHRKQLLSGMPVTESIAMATGTSGTAVVFAGATVIIALLALNVTGIPFLGLMGTVGAACVAIAVLISVTLTPALLSLLGVRLLSRRRRKAIDATSGGRPERPIRAMSSARAVFTAIATVATLLVLAAPALSMRVGLPDSSSDPQDSTSYRSFMAIEENFGAGANGPLLVAAEVPEGLDDDDVLGVQVDVAEVLAELPHVDAVAPIGVSEDNTLLAFQVQPSDGPNSLTTEHLVEQIRSLEPVNGDISVAVAGQAAINIDISEAILDVLPLYLSVVLGLSLIIMILVFRSLLVPLIATGGFVLSLFATFGLIVALFQFGWGAELIGLHSTGPILSFLPVLLVGILFGLAMDYQLFLTSGMREAFVHGASPRIAVTTGLHAGRSVVIAAGLIMIAVFGGLIFTDATMIRSIGFGLAFGVLLDAFVVRLLLMPALMHLLGASAWWLPRWLDRLLPHVDIEGSSLATRRQDTATTVGLST